MRVFFSLCLSVWLCVPATGLNIQVKFLWDKEALTIPASNLITPDGERIQISRLDFLINQPELTFESGRTISASKWHAYVNGESLKTLRFPLLPDEQIKKLVLHLGPDSKINSGNPNQYPSNHALNPLHNNLHWSPQSGYIFFALEGHLSDHDLAFAYHYGNNENRLSLEFSQPLETKGSYQLNVHLDRLFSTKESRFNIRSQPSTHSRAGDPVLAHFKASLPSVFTLTDYSTENLYQEEKPKLSRTSFVGTPYPFTIPTHVPIPQLPTDYPFTKERVSLGKLLFHEPLLSQNASLSCASCHSPKYGFSDPNAQSTGHDGRDTSRHSMPLVNLAWKASDFLWDGRISHLRKQILAPIEHPDEMGESLENVIKKLENASGYHNQFQTAFGDFTITAHRISVAIEQYLLSLTSFNSKFDQSIKGLAKLSPLEQKGFQLFMTENDPRLGLRGADCFHCHGGPLFTNFRFHNNGLPPTNDIGRELITKNVIDRLKFSTPSLRNIALTAPYMHDGRFKTLEDVVEFYSTGIHRSPSLDPNMAKHPGTGLNFTEEEKRAILAFLHTLTDKDFE